MEASKKIHYVYFDGSNSDEVKTFLLNYTKGTKCTEVEDKSVVVPEWQNNDIKVKVIKLNFRDNQIMYLVQGQYLACWSKGDGKPFILTSKEFKDQFDDEVVLNSLSVLPNSNSCANCPWWLNRFNPQPNPYPNPFPNPPIISYVADCAKCK